MIFMSYWFVAFAAVFFPLFWLVRHSMARRLLLLGFCLLFEVHFAGPAGVAPVIVLAVATYAAGVSRSKLAIIPAIVLNVVALVFYKYTLFLSESLLGFLGADAVQLTTTYVKEKLLPSAPPLAISFFVFEFVHYLTDVMRGKPSIRSPLQFSLFATFFPSLVAGPVKRYEQFLPAVDKAVTTGPEGKEIAIGFTRVMIGVVKKTIADNLTAIIAVQETQYDAMPLFGRWLFVIAVAFRILLDFSGYSDMAIGLARMMGVRLPENFNWPYLATSIADFWRRWHISLSTWIRDYIYIPLGGSRHGGVRRVINALVAFGLCGLWHGAGWNFAIWGIYHGVGVAASTALTGVLERTTLPPLVKLALPFLGWVTTMVFVLVGWLFFFYPAERAVTMTGLLFGMR